MADFTTWERATLEQFAQEATAKLIKNKAETDELVTALKEAAEIVAYPASGMTHAKWMTDRASECLSRIKEVIEKHTTTKEQ